MRYRRGFVGDYMAESDVVLTSTLNKTTPFPKISLESSRKITYTLKRIDKWLLDNAISEAMFRDDKFNLLYLRSLSADELTISDKDFMDYYLFDDDCL